MQERSVIDEELFGRAMDVTSRFFEAYEAATARASLSHASMNPDYVAHFDGSGSAADIYNRVLFNFLEPLSQGQGTLTPEQTQGIAKFILAQCDADGRMGTVYDAANSVIEELAPAIEARFSNAEEIYKGLLQHAAVPLLRKVHTQFIKDTASLASGNEWSEARNEIDQKMVRAISTLKLLITTAPAITH